VQQTRRAVEAIRSIDPTIVVGGVEAYLVAHPDEVTPYKILSDAVEAVRQVVTGRRRLFSS